MTIYIYTHMYITHVPTHVYVYVCRISRYDCMSVCGRVCESVYVTV